VRDFTERKEAEQALKQYSERLERMVEQRTRELKDAQEQLIGKERLAVLGQVAGGIGHELRNPLGAIKNAAYFLNLALGKPEPEVKETLEIVSKEVATCERTISTLLDFARQKPPSRRKADINGVVREALSRITVPGNVEVVSQLDETLPAIMADSDQLRQVFENIILNAIQAMPAGGRLGMESRTPSAGWVAVSIADTGVGISLEKMPRLFEPLFTTKAKGVGLGLALTKMLVEAHGGAIHVQSEVGRGSTFAVRLPVS
jgi:signal transduction histidine kinase